MHLTFSDGGRTFVVIVRPGDEPKPVSDDHPKFESIMSALEAGDEVMALDLADVGTTIDREFHRLSERVTVEDGVVKFDGVGLHDALTEQILRVFREGDPKLLELEALINYFENVQQNPSEHSRTQLYDWVGHHDVTIDLDGYLIAYKGVASRPDGGWQSIQRGTAYVNDEKVTGAIPYAVGDQVEMPRDEVTWDPAQHCAPGLHVGTYDYAGSWARGAMLKVRVNPRDVVSVPGDAGGEKIRVSRFEILDTIDAPITAPVDYDQDDDSDYEQPWHAREADEFAGL